MKIDSECHIRLFGARKYRADTLSPGLGSMTEQDCDGGTVNELFYINIEPKTEIKTPKASKKSKHTIV